MQAPADQSGREQRGYDRVDEAQALQIEQAAATGTHFRIDAAGEAVTLAEGGAERAYDMKVADHVDEFAVHRRRALREGPVQRHAIAGEQEDHEPDHRARN